MIQIIDKIGIRNNQVLATTILEKMSVQIFLLISN